MMLAAKQIFLGRCAKAAPTAKSYVQDGLIAMWDGIENAGWGVHDVNAAVWKDLAGNGYDLILNPSGVQFADDNLACDKPSNGGYAFSNTSTDYSTIEICFSSSRKTTAKQCLFYSSSRAYRFLYYFIGHGFQFGFSASTIAESSYVAGAKYHLAATYTAASDNNASALFKDGLQTSPSDYEESWGTPSKMGIGRYGASNYYFHGSIFAIRLYNRALTAAEFAANYAVDKARFN